MKYSTAVGFLAAIAAPLASAHAKMAQPVPLGSKVDFDMTTPVTRANFPCRNHLNLLGTPDGAPVATWPAGSKQQVTIDGGALHNGGSCQISLSYDKGKTWKVIHSFMGGCPASNVPLDFTIPDNAPAGDTVLAWSWSNNTGNREFYMNCAAITITGGGAKTKTKTKRASFNDLPDMFVVNLDKDGCQTAEGTDVEYPNPGEFVTKGGSGKLAKPTGPCGAPAAGDGNGAGNGDQQDTPPAPAPDNGDNTSAPVPAPPTPTTPDNGSGNGGGSTTGVPTPNPGSGSDTTPPVVTSIPGGVFAPAPDAGTSTTFSTVTKGPETSAPPESSAPPTLPPPTNDVSGDVAGALSGACTEDGAWNCISGTAFQRCASGSWSQAIGMAPGTTCTPGVAATLSMARRSVRGGSRPM